MRAHGYGALLGSILLAACPGGNVGEPDASGGDAGVAGDAGGGVDAGADAGPTTPPGAFQLQTPTDGSFGVSTTPTLQWTTSVGADSYTVEVATSSTFGVTVVDETTGVTSLSLTLSAAIAAGVIHYWR